MILPLISQSFSSNTYVLIDKKKAVIDPGISAENLLRKFDEEKIKLDFILLTHCHYDHTACVQKIKEMTKAKVLAHELCAEIFENDEESATLAGLFNSPSLKIKVDKKLKDGDVIDLGTMKLEVLHTPGHTQESICLYDKKTKSLFSGDTIFADGIGRTDLPGGDFSMLKESIEKLMKLNEKQEIEKVYSGHGPIGTGNGISKIYRYYFPKV